jgi:hypothetical protein
MKAVSPWRAGEECALEGFQSFKKALNRASFHNSADFGGRAEARAATDEAVRIAIEQRWPYWAMERMFREIAPLVDWSTFMQKYIDQLVDS